MHCYFVVESMTPEPHSTKDEGVFQDADTIFKGVIISMLEDFIVDAQLTMSTCKEIWDTLEAKYGVSDVGSELYVMEQFHDYKLIMVDLQQDKLINYMYW